MSRATMRGGVVSCGVVVGLLLGAGGARAQYYAQTPGSYVPLGAVGHAIIDPSMGTDPANVGEVSGTVTGTDNGVAILTLGGASPWSFQFGGIAYGKVSVAVDGFLALLGTANSCGCNADTDPNALAACSAPLTSCAGGCGPGAAGAVGCCALNNSCTPGGGCTANATCGGSCCNQCGPNAPNANPFFGNSIAPSMIGAWVEDLDDSPNQGIRYRDDVDANGNHFLTVDYHGVQTSQAGPALNTCFSCTGQTVYDFSITLYQPAAANGGGDGIVSINYGPAMSIGADDTCQAFVGVQDENANSILPLLNETQNFNNNCFNSACGQFSSGCQFSCGGWPGGSTLIYYDSRAPAGALVVPASVSMLNPTIGGGATPSVTFDLSTTVNNLGGGNVAGASLSYGVYLSSQEVIGLPSCAAPLCLGTQTQALAAGQLAPFTVGNNGNGQVLAAGLSVTTASTLTVGIPPTLGPGIYYALLNFGGGSPVESAASVPLAFGPDPAAISIAIPVLPNPDGTFNAQLEVQNVGFMPEPAFNYSLYLLKDSCGSAFDPKTAPFLGKFAGGALAALSGPVGIQAKTLGPVLPAGAVLQQGNYNVVVVLSSTDDLNTANNQICSLDQIAISPPALHVTDVLAPAICYIDRNALIPYDCDVSYTVSNLGTELAQGFDMGVFAHESTKGPDVKPLVDAKLYNPNTPLLNWGPITLGGNCSMAVSQAGQVVVFTPAGCGQGPAAATPHLAMPFTFPNGTAIGGANHPLPADYQIGVFADPESVVAGAGAGRNKGAPQPTLVAFADPDLTVFAGDLNAPPVATAGEPMIVDKVIRNVGPVAGGAPYAYYLSAVGLVGTNGVPVPVRVGSTVTYLPTTGTLQPPSGAGATLADRDQTEDTLLLPPGLSAGTYTLTVAIDPQSTTQEVHRDNKIQSASAVIAISASPIQIVDSVLPVAVVDEPYSPITLEATGGLYPYSWSLLAGSPPAGITLSADGVISGTPTTLGDSTFAAQVTSGQQSQIVTLFLAVVQAGGPLQILSPSPLPVATVGQYYAQALAAQGGVPPYVWTGTAPPSFTLDPSGLLFGTPLVATREAQPFSVVVSDAVGNRVSGSLAVQVLQSAPITISTDPSCPTVLAAGGYCLASIPAQMIGQPFSETFYAFETGGAQHTFSWTFPAGQVLPAGVFLEAQSGPDVALNGTPREQGIFPFSLVVADEAQLTATRHFVLVVGSVADFAGGGAEQLPAATPGVLYGPVNLTLSTSSVPLTWALYSGELPPGLSIQSNGTIGGTVPTTAEVRFYSFVAAVESQPGGVALVPASIQVIGTLAKSTGCQSGGGDLGLAAMGLVLLLLHRRRPRADA